jgi:hypothetical protein
MLKILLLCGLALMLSGCIKRYSVVEPQPVANHNALAPSR